jgi:membrane-bound serine protease (ClpP class)
VAIGDLSPEGRVFVHGEYWNAVAASPLKSGERVRVTAVDQLKLTVQPVENQSGG